MRKWISMLVVLAFVASTAFASGNDLAYRRIQELETATTVESGDYTVVYDASTDSVKKVDANSPAAISGDVTFRATLLAAGRTNAASSAASSSTDLAPSSLPYVVLRKYIGGASGLDETDGGTRLQNGTNGQILVLQAMDVDAGGSWIVTPRTSVQLTTLTFDAAGETATLMFVDSTIGWLLIANEGATVVYTRQSGIPSKP
jgi:hypothetical protein